MLMEKKTGIVVGIANHRSIAWTIAKTLDREGAKLVLGYLGDRERASIEKIVDQLSTPPVLVPCDVSTDRSVENAFAEAGRALGKLDFVVHGVAFANKNDLNGRYTDTSRDGYRIALDVSAYSLNCLVRFAEPLMGNGGSVVALTYLGSERVVRNYNVMGVAKAALEASVRYLAYDLGTKGTRVNAISAGPVRTLAASGISGFKDMLHYSSERAPLKRNIDQEEVGRTALYLLSDMASAVTGEVLHVDAGYNIMGM